MESSIKWEKIGERPNLYRTPVPGGWLVRICSDHDKGIAYQLGAVIRTRPRPPGGLRGERTHTERTLSKARRTCSGVRSHPQSTM